MPAPSRADFENAARAYFQILVEQLDRPRGFSNDPDRYDRDVEYDVHMHEERNINLGDQLSRNEFDGIVYQHAVGLAKTLGLEFDLLTEDQRVAVSRLAVRAEIAQSELYRHQITNPFEPFKTTDELFWTRGTGLPSPDIQLPLTPQNRQPSATLKKAADEYVARKKAIGITENQTDEIARVLGWLQEVVGFDAALDTISMHDLRRFRDDLGRRNVRLRGRRVPFKAGLTTDPNSFILFQTAIRYWNATQAFFEWTVSEGLLVGDDPASKIRMARPKDVVQHSPEAFTPADIQRLLNTPLYTGHKSPKRLTEPGDYHSRNGPWWFILLAMHCGARAGELCQLLPSDFIFDDPVPHWKFQFLDGDQKKTKTLKNRSSQRDVPIHPRLLELGLREFVEGRAKRFPEQPVLGFRLGTRGRTSAGASRFWTDYLKKFGFHSKGRSTHVWRHTVSDVLRSKGVPEEDIGALFGHASRSQTSKYGSGQPLSRKLETVSQLDFGFDVVAALGGPYNPAKHGKW